MGSSQTWLIVIHCRNGEIGVENLVNESGVGEPHWVGEREGGERKTDEVGVDVLGLVAIFKDEVLEERIGRKWGREKFRGKEQRRVREYLRFGFREQKWECPSLLRRLHRWLLRWRTGSV